MPRNVQYVVFLCLLALVASACGGSNPIATQEPTAVPTTSARNDAPPAATATPAEEPAAVATETPAPVPTEVKAATTTSVPQATETEEPAPTAEPTAVPTVTQQPATATPEPTATQSPTPTDVPATPTPAPDPSALAKGTITDGETGKPVARAWVYLGDTITRSDKQGRFSFEEEAGDKTLTVMAPGYAKYETKAANVRNGAVGLERFDARGIFIPFYGVAEGRPQVEEMLDLVEESPTLNTIVVDVKDDSGQTWDVDVPLAKENGSSQDYMDLKKFTDEAHKRGIYVIGRFVVFKDNTAAEGTPEWAVKSTEGGLWEDNIEQNYLDPFDEAAWDYLADVAIDIIGKGVDEIQYDYVRFPVEGGLSTLSFDRESTEQSRTQQIAKFVKYMEERIRPHKAFISADTFGLTAWVDEEQGTGQVLEEMAPYMDYYSPMIYPSLFSSGWNGWEYPTEHAYELVKDSVEISQKRLKGLQTRVRPFLQYYPDTAYNRPFSIPQYREQARAANEAGTSGWLFWNVSFRFKAEAFATNP